MLKTTCYLSCSFDRVLRSWTNWWNLNWLVRGNLRPISKLTLVIHAPSIDIASHWDCNCELLTHLNICNAWYSVRIILLDRLLARRDSSWVNIWGRLITISENYLTWVLANRLFFDFIILWDVLVISTCAPLINRPINKDTSWVNESTCNCLNSYSWDHLHFVLISIEKLDLLEGFLCLPRSMPKSKCWSISTREKSVHASSDNCMNWSTLDLLYFLFVVK
jgi:hypothetical protein